MKISIVCASYNYADYIKEAVESVLKQTYKDWEMIIVDDGSTDNSIEVIKSFCEKDERIKLFTHPDNVNKGLKETLLFGIQKAESDWIAFLESDDAWCGDYLEKKVEIAEKFPQTALIFNDVELFGNEKKVALCGPVFDKTRVFLKSKVFPKNMFKDFNVNNVIFTFSSVMIKKQVLLNTDFNTPCDKLLDWWLYINISYDTDFYYLPDKLTRWRLHPDSYINKKNKTFHFLNLSAYFNVYKREKKLWILFFTIYSSIFIFVKIFKKLAFYKILLIRKIKTILGIPLKDSPLF